MSVLAAPLSLGEQFPGPINDVEALVRRVLRDRLGQFGAHKKLNDHDEEDAVTYLIGVAYECSRRYDPAKERNPARANFAAYAAKIVSFRVADWYRQRFGDTRHGDKPVVLSLDAPQKLGAQGQGNDFSTYTDGPDRLVDTLVASSGDPAEDRAPDLVGVLNRRGGEGAEAHDPVGEPETGGASRRAAGAAGKPRSAAGLKHGRVVETRRAPSKPPICPHCFGTFRKAFGKVNNKVTPALRLTDDQLDEKAAKRARAVKFGSEWACPRCTRLTDPLGHELMLQQAYPNRQARRAAVGKGGRGAAPKNRAKAGKRKR